MGQDEQTSGSVQQEQAALHQEAQEAIAAFGGTADVPGGAGGIESDPDTGKVPPPSEGAHVAGAAPSESATAGTGGPNVAGAGGTGGGSVGGGPVDTGAPERAREENQEDAGGGLGPRQYDEPSTGEMLASELGSEPSMQWEGKIAEKLTGSSGETTGTEKA